MYREEILL